MNMDAHLLRSAESLRTRNVESPLPEGRTAFIAFGPYRLFPNQRRLERAGHVVELGSRAFDILCILTERGGEVVTNRELMARVWGNVVVGEGSLRFHINALRKALARDAANSEYIKNLARRGYSFIAPVQRAFVERPARADISPIELGKLPRRLGNVVGRAAEIQEVVTLIGQTRLLTIVGPGGVGKSTVAIEAAYLLREQFDLVTFVDLETVKDASWVASAVASALGLVVSTASPVSNLSAYLREKRVLLILDSCERVLEAAAMLAELICHGSDGSAILATSQEALRADGEHVYTLGSLRAPAEGMQLSPAEAMRYPAIELFVARARETVTQFELTAANAATIGAICRRVDGIPLAIELAARRVGTLALPSILDLLNSRFALTWPGRRTAAERHRTLGAAIAWTVELLDEREQVLLRRLAVFSGPFTLEAAQHVASGSTLPISSVAEALSNLVAKSLVSTSSLDRLTHTSCPDQATHFWLLGLTHAFASQRLEDSGESAEVAQRHAIYLCELLERTYAGPTEVLHAQAWRSHAAYLSNVRSALDWTVRHEEGAELVSRLAAAACPFFLDLSLLSECVRWASTGLEALNGRSGSHQELELQASLGLSLFFSRGSLEDVRIALIRALELADEQRDHYNQMRLLGALSNLYQRTEEMHRALSLARRAKVVAQSSDDRACRAVADWLLGTASHFVGDHATARRLGARAWSGPSLRSVAKRARFSFCDHRIRALGGLARSLWLLGKADEACSAVPRVVQEAEQFGHPIALAVALSWVTPIWLWAGERQAADEYSHRLVAHAEEHSLDVYRCVGRAYQGELAVERGEAEVGLEMLQEASESMQLSRFGVLQTAFSQPLALALAQLGRVDEALAVVDGALEADERAGGSFNSPELLRAKGSLLAEYVEGRHVEAEALLRQSLERARQQGALALELRAAISLARLDRTSAPSTAAHALLRQTYSRFSQGFATRDLMLARQLLEESARESGVQSTGRVGSKPI
jgi:predicted ATPase/DNA-binding winged helix-turn-helix (wHTH) protein